MDEHDRGGETSPQTGSPVTVLVLCLRPVDEMLIVDALQGARATAHVRRPQNFDELEELALGQLGQFGAVVLVINRPGTEELRAVALVRRGYGGPLIAVLPRYRYVHAVPLLLAGATVCIADEEIIPLLGLQLHALLGLSQRERQVICIGDLCLDLTRREATVKGRRLPLTPAEFAILARLAQNAGTVVDPRDLLEASPLSERPVARDQLKVYVYRLRQKLLDAGLTNATITTVRGFGYAMTEQGEAGPAEEPAEGR